MIKLVVQKMVVGSLENQEDVKKIRKIFDKIKKNEKVDLSEYEKGLILESVINYLQNEKTMPDVVTVIMVEDQKSGKTAMLVDSDLSQETR